MPTRKFAKTDTLFETKSLAKKNVHCSGKLLSCHLRKAVYRKVPTKARDSLATFAGEHGCLLHEICSAHLYNKLAQISRNTERLASLRHSAAPSLLISKQLGHVDVPVTVLSVELNGVVLALVSFDDLSSHVDESLQNKRD